MISSDLVAEEFEDEALLIDITRKPVNKEKEKVDNKDKEKQSISNNDEERRTERRSKKKVD